MASMKEMVKRAEKALVRMALLAGWVHKGLSTSIPMYSDKVAFTPDKKALEKARVELFKGAFFEPSNIKGSGDSHPASPEGWFVKDSFRKTWPEAADPGDVILAGASFLPCELWTDTPLETAWAVLDRPEMIRKGVTDLAEMCLLSIPNNGILETAALAKVVVLRDRYETKDLSGVTATNTQRKALRIVESLFREYSKALEPLDLKPFVPGDVWFGEREWAANKLREVWSEIQIADSQAKRVVEGKGEVSYMKGEIRFGKEKERISDSAMWLLESLRLKKRTGEGIGRKERRQSKSRCLAESAQKALQKALKIKWPDHWEHIRDALVDCSKKDALYPGIALTEERHPPKKPKPKPYGDMRNLGPGPIGKPRRKKDRISESRKREESDKKY